MSGESQVESQVVEVLKDLGVKLLEAQTKTDELMEKHESCYYDSDGETEQSAVRSLVMAHNDLVTEAFETALTELPTGNSVFPRLGKLMAKFVKKNCEHCPPPKWRECTECEKCGDFHLVKNEDLEYYFSGSGAEVRFGFPSGYDMDCEYPLFEGFFESLKDDCVQCEFSVKPVGEDRWLVKCNSQTQEFSTANLDKGLTSMLKFTLLAL